jgi:transcriptional regulator with XRE-family HTH domain
MEGEAPSDEHPMARKRFKNHPPVMSNIFDTVLSMRYASTMFPNHELSTAVKTRRSEIGLSQTALARLAGLSRATVNQIENGSFKDLSLHRAARLLNTLGLSLTVSPAHPKRGNTGVRPASPLDIAARSASVSYRSVMRGSQLKAILSTGKIPTRLEPHMNVLLEEASVRMLASVVEQIHVEDDVPRTELWTRLRALAEQLGCVRDLWE